MNTTDATHTAPGTTAAAYPVTDSGPAAAITKLGTADFRDRVITGYIRHTEPSTIVLRQLFPGDPKDIGAIDEIEAASGQVTIYPRFRHAWTDTDRAALAGFFVHRWHDRRRALGTLTPQPQPQPQPHLQPQPVPPQEPKPPPPPHQPSPQQQSPPAPLQPSAPSPSQEAARA